MMQTLQIILAEGLLKGESSVKNAYIDSEALTNLIFSNGRDSFPKISERTVSTKETSLELYFN